jgi:hypothetical protein
MEQVWLDDVKLHLRILICLIELSVRKATRLDNVARCMNNGKDFIMSISNDELTKQNLVDLNKKIGEMEQEQGEQAHLFFNAHLSEQLIFRRVSGKTVGKTGPEGFLEGLNKPSPFKSRESEDISVNLLGDRALVTLIVRTRKEDGPENRYRNIRLFFRSGDDWILEFWYNYEITSL